MVLSREFLNHFFAGHLLFNADGQIIDCNATAVKLLGTERNQLLGREWYEMGSRAVHEDGSPFPYDEQPSMVSLRTGEPSGDVVVGNQMLGHPRRWLQIRAYPLLVEGQVQGVFSMFIDVSDRVRGERARRVLFAVNQFVTSGAIGEDSLQHLCDVFVTNGSYPLVGVAVVPGTDESGYDVVYAAARDDRVRNTMTSLSGGERSGLGSIGTALRTKVTQVINDMENHPSSKPLGEWAMQLGLGSVVAIPFALRGLQAALFIFDGDAFSFDETTVLELETIAREFEFGTSLLHTVEELAATLEGTFRVLAEMTATRDPYTAGHQTRVGLLGEAIARHLRLDAMMTRLVRQSGDLHDVGKIAIPSEILTRPGRLSAIELEMTKTHTTVGFNILSKASLPWPIAEVALQHHERLDGSGYPSGLVADEINLPARIIAVADVVEAMTHHRPYRPGLGLETALVEVSQGAGILYDGAVVEACLAVFEAGYNFDP